SKFLEAGPARPERGRQRPRGSKKSNSTSNVHDGSTTHPAGSPRVSSKISAPDSTQNRFCSAALVTSSKPWSTRDESHTTGTNRPTIHIVGSAWDPSRRYRRSVAPRRAGRFVS
ncbi:hypothetical protein BV898_19831, partial [Hypsibius exemplaris]